MVVEGNGLGMERRGDRMEGVMVKCWVKEKGIKGGLLSWVEGVDERSERKGNVNSRWESSRRERKGGIESWVGFRGEGDGRGLGGEGMGELDVEVLVEGEDIGSGR